jgi:hypothetical protein
VWIETLKLTDVIDDARTPRAPRLASRARSRIAMSGSNRVTAWARRGLDDVHHRDDP